ncbi:MAG: MnhB domain-containing protein [Candidatus Muiribacteriota bacterium]
MELSNSSILKTTLRKLFPFIILFSFYMFSYGANFPGGGFQAGVVAGTIIIIYQLVFEKEIYSNNFYSFVEFSGFFLMTTFLLVGILFSGYYFGIFYGLQTNSTIFSNFFIWLLNLAIYLEVCGSIVLIFRYLIKRNI